LPSPPSPGKKTLVLDLDATLIDTLHFNQEGKCDPDFIYTGRNFNASTKIYLP
jgi:hypothetical protein